MFQLDVKRGQSYPLRRNVLLRTLTAPHDTGYTEQGTGNTKRYIDAQYRRLTDDSRHVACTQSPTG